MDFNGLSLDQAPPISAPLRFFITAPIFGMLAGILLLFSDSASLMSRYSIDAIVVTHLITIGLFGFIMLGALTQMLPVLASAKIPKVKFVSSMTHLFLLIGLLCMAAGLESGNAVLLWAASFLLGSGFVTIILSMLYAMKDVEHFTASIKGMRMSLYFAFLIVMMGVYLLHGYSNNDITQLHYEVANVHSTWAVFGFAGILIIGVAFQVLPMFYVAPRFKQFCKKRVVLLITAGLIIWMLLSFFAQEYTLYAKLWIVTFFWAFATTVWIKFNKRKRPISDVTVWYWRAASVFLTLGSFLWIFDEFFKHQYIVMVGILIGGGFILSIMLGMLYKIVPFLVWFHLNGMGYMTIPTMNEMINKTAAKMQYLLFILSLVGSVFSFYMPSALVPSALAFITSMAILEYNILAPVFIYMQTKKKKPDFDMSAFA
ncbi:hypothetical protein [Sulfurimonas paralvinellae]|uniref:Uncharacterized protein n=1 Tax=Sulfurimonas paralvinellae TaxID=317658 RepID=A0A7M1BBM0_9BACT|nr:hypothetical protein [Sulfurimonas paralvinellae]QOP46192.1 hypothetical protein FM071_07755 [Sulfurimonas paralvinellae]